MSQAVFPARAGMSRSRPPLSWRAVSFPRPRGDEPDCDGPAHYEYAFSPPARG